MPAFEFQALDRSGKITRGVLQGDSPRQVRQLLREREMTPMAVTPVNTRSRRGWRGRQLGNGELALVLRQLGTLVQAAVPLEEALATIADQAERQASRRLFSALRASVTEGRSLAQSMEAFPGDFPDWISASVAAGEQSGKLEQVLDRLADYSERRQATRSTVILTLIYPVVVAIIAIAVIATMMVYVVPRVVQVFEQGHQTLPLLTRGLIATSDVLQNYGGLLLLALLLLVSGGAWMMRSDRVRFRLQHVAMKLPLVGRLWRSVNTSRFTRTLSLLIGSAVPLVEALPVAARVMPGLPMRQAVEKATAQVREGAPLSRALAQSELFPPMVIRLVASGEKSGQLEAMLEKAASSEEQNLDLVSRTVISLLQPALILLVGLFVLVVVLAIMLPIMSFNQLIA